MSRTTLNLSIRRNNGLGDPIPLPDLHEILERLGEGLVGIARDAGHQPDEVMMAIERIGSEGFELAVTKPTVVSCQLLGQAIRERDYSVVPTKGRDAIVGLSVVARRNGWNIEVQQCGEVLVGIPSDYQPPTRETFLEPSTISGNVRRIDDHHQAVILRLPTRRKRTFLVASPALIGELRPYFYRDVVLRGQAQRFVDTGTLAEFVVMGIDSSKPT